MRSVEMKHEGVEGTALFPETAVAHWERAGWTVVDSDAGEFVAPENRPPSPPSEQSGASGEASPAESSSEASITRRRPSPRPEGSA